MSRTAFDPYLVRWLLSERGSEPFRGATVQAQWAAAGENASVRRAILLTQLASLRIRRGVIGRYFDDQRVAHRGQLQSAQPGVEVGGQRWNTLGNNGFRSRCAHEALPSPVATIL
jgi:hypothetical protein